MNTNKYGKFLSLILRHKPEVIGLTLDKNGWVDTDTLLNALKLHNRVMTLDQLKYIVKNDDKKRFAFSEDKKKIRANQGHSLEVDLNYVAKCPPAQLYHGTTDSALTSILNNGISKMSRHHVHLSADIETAIKVGKRHGKPIVIIVDAAIMNAHNYTFFMSDNGVWLTDNVPSCYFIDIKEY